MQSFGFALWTAVACTAVVVQPAWTKFYYDEYKTVAQLAARAQPRSPLMNLWSSALETVTGTIYRLLQVDTTSRSDQPPFWEYPHYSEYPEYQHPEYPDFSDSASAGSAAQGQHYIGVYPEHGDRCGGRCQGHAALPESVRSPELGPDVGSPEYASDPGHRDYGQYGDGVSAEEGEPLVAPFVPGGTVWVGVQMVLPVTVTAATAARNDRQTQGAGVEGGSEQGD